jgi:hypothetical protein
MIISTAANRILQDCYKNLSNDNKIITSGNHNRYYNSAINKKFTIIMTKIIIISLISMMIKVIFIVYIIIIIMTVSILIQHRYYLYNLISETDSGFFHTFMQIMNSVHFIYLYYQYCYHDLGILKLFVVYAGLYKVNRYQL